MTADDTVFGAACRAAPVTIICLDPAGQVVAINKRGEQQIAYASEQLVGRSFFELVRPEPSAAALRQAYERVMAGDPLRDFEQLLLCGDGKVRCFRWDGDRVLGADGVPTGGVVVGHSQLEIRRRKDDRHLQRVVIMERINAIMLRSTDLNEMMRDVLGAILSIFECDRAWLLFPCDPDAASWHVPMEQTVPRFPGALELGKPIPMTPDAAELFSTVLASAGAVPYGPGSGRDVPEVASEQFGVQSQLTLAIHPKLGRPWVLGLHHCDAARPYTPEECEILGAIGQRLGDSLSSLLALRDLRRSEASLWEAQRIAHMGSWSLEPDSGALDWSEEVYRICGEDRTEFAATYVAFLDIVHDSDRTRVDEAVQQIRTGGRAFDIVHRLSLRDGAIKHVRLRGEAAPGGPVGTIQDITEQTVAKIALEEYRDRLEEIVAERTTELTRLNQDLEAFSAAVSHDLRAPLRTITTFSALIEDNYADRLDDEGLRLLGFVRRGCRDMRHIIEDLLVLARVSSAELRRERVDLTQMARDIADGLRGEDDDRDVQWRVAEGLSVVADEGLLRIVLQNLIGNAWKFTSKTTNALIEIGARQDGDATHFFVRDNGAGFDPVMAKDLFEPLRRLHTADEFPGTGVGLSTVHRIVERHGGRVWGEGALGAGATFSFAFDK